MNTPKKPQEPPQPVSDETFRAAIDQLFYWDLVKVDDKGLLKPREVASGQVTKVLGKE